jgi:ABC-type lipoprotein release transport system permease subunit
MTGRTAIRYARRSLFRQPRRTLLSMIGAGIGCGIAIFALAWITGAAEMEIRAVVESGVGHLKVVHEAWPERHEQKLRIQEYEKALEAARNLEGVAEVAARARTNGLLAFGNRTRAVEVTGVQPEREMASNRVVYKAEIRGRYLEPGEKNSVVIGSTLAERLDVDLDDDLYVTLSGKSEMQSAMLTIKGILSTGSENLDAGFCQTTLSALSQITGYDGAGEISILLEDYRDIGRAGKALADALPEGNTVITWQQADPAMAAGIEADRAFMRLLVIIIVIVVALGIASAQLTAVLERRTEFAILAALGMRSRQVIALMLVEAVIIGIGGAVFALLTGGPASYYTATRGISLEALMGDTAFGNVLLDPVLYGSFGPWMIGYAFGISIVSTVIASIYPAWLATKTDPADALRIV